MVRVFLLLMVFTLSAQAKEFVEEVEKDFPLRSIGQLKITNTRGDLTVQGWAMDKVRLKLIKRVTATDPVLAKKKLDTLDYQYLAEDRNIQISSQYRSDMSIKERLEEKEQASVRTDLIVFAPFHLKLEIWAVDGKIVLKSWNAKTEIRLNSGSVQVDGLKADLLSTSCTQCSVQLRNIRGSVRCTGGTGLVDLNNVFGKSIYLETTSGGIKVSHIEGDQLYSSRTGSLDGQYLSGRVEFHAQKSQVKLRELSGFVSGTLEAGDILADVRDWDFMDKALIESSRGNIQLTLPRHFSGNVDLWSLQGKVMSEFAVEKLPDLTTFGPEPSNHWVGRIRDGGELLKVFTEQGEISISKRKL